MFLVEEQGCDQLALFKHVKPALGIEAVIEGILFAVVVMFGLFRLGREFQAVIDPIRLNLERRLKDNHDIGAFVFIRGEQIVGEFVFQNKFGEQQEAVVGADDHADRAGVRPDAIGDGVLERGLRGNRKRPQQNGCNNRGHADAFGPVQKLTPIPYPLVSCAGVSQSTNYSPIEQERNDKCSKRSDNTRP